jgi:hypothetical protein
MTGALVMNVAAASGVTAITGGSAADTLRGDAASTINGGEGSDAIFGGTGNDVLNGDAGNDTITTDTGNDNVNGGDGNDTLTFGANLSALDTVAGGLGNDSISLTNASLTALKALTISEANTFNTNFTSVETLVLTDALDQTSFDLGYMNTLSSVRLDAGITGPEALNGFDSGDSLDLRAALGDTLTVGVNNASSSTTDALTVVLGVSGNTDYSDLSIANVETVTINNTEATANALVRTNTIGLGITQATGGAAQSVIINGTEALTIDTAIAARTVNASGMTVVQATDAGLTMGVALTATTAITGQTMTGSGKVDVLRGSTGSDSIDAGAGSDAIHGNRGSDTIDGGAGTDTYHTTNLVGANIEGAGTGTSTGVVINLGATTLSNATVLANSTQNLSGNLASVASGQVAYLFGASAPTNSSVVKTISNVENVTLAGNGINYVVGSDAANSIVGGTGADYLSGGLGADTIKGGADIDTIVLTETTSSSSVDVVDLSDVSVVANRDSVIGFVTTVDKVWVAAANTTVATAAGTAAVFGASTTAAGGGGGAVALTGVSSTLADVIFLTVGAVGANTGDLSASTTGVELLKAMTDATAADTYTGITANTAADKVYFAAVQGGITYLYYADAGAADTTFSAAEILLVGTFNSATLVGGDFVMA